MPTQPLRPADRSALTIASTTGCLIEHAVAFRRLQQIAAILTAGAPPSTDVMLASATRAEDDGLCHAITTCAPLSTALAELAKSTILAYTAAGPARAEAVKTVIAADAPIIDAGGIHSGGHLIVAATDPQGLLDIVCIQQEILNWTPDHIASSADEFVRALDTALPNINALAAALGRTVGDAAIRTALLAS